ncbi:hypothetical protein EVAR_90386_1 [Eumeta japonica]|uniref:Uncharacterized protein n=1 Tax=Eumeta variegata TaxID=151549 RepID=A0A4C1ZU15_EUMVA|nr:hypothetical protein EVAR_90386_1 [Eumeta japonica]
MACPIEMRLQDGVGAASTDRLGCKKLTRLNNLKKGTAKTTEIVVNRHLDRKRTQGRAGRAGRPRPARACRSNDTFPVPPTDGNHKVFMAARLQPGAPNLPPRSFRSSARAGATAAVPAPDSVPQTGVYPTTPPTSLGIRPNSVKTA